MKKNKSGIIGILAAAVLIASFFPLQPAAADEQGPTQETAKNTSSKATFDLGTIIVTSQKRQENIQKVPASITALSEIRIEDSMIREMEELGFYTPGLYIGNSGDNAELSPIIRGMYNRMNPNPTVGLYVDGVAYSRHQAYDTDLSDVERIEVIKGPQGTLFGRNTEAGVIRIITKKPGNEWEGRASARCGNYNTRDYTASVKGPLVKDKLAFGISAKQYLSDGYFTNNYLDRDDAEESDDRSGRATLRWTPGEAWDIILRADAEHAEGGFFTYAPIENITHDINLDYLSRLDKDLTGQSLYVNYEANRFNMTSITAHRDGDYRLSYDMDATAMDFLRDHYGQEHGQWSQEVRIASTDDAKAFKWLIGIYYFDEEFDVDNTYDYRQGYPAMGLPPFSATMKTQLDTQNYAFFGQATWTFWEKLGLTAGLRYDNDKKEFKGIQFHSPDVMGTGISRIEKEKTLEAWLPKFVVDYRFTTNVMGYAGISRGYTAGSFNDLDASVLGVPYDAEFSWNYEAGVKTAWLDNRLILNLAAYYIDWKDKQVFIHTGAASNIFKNAAEATSKGVEIEILARPVPGMEIVGGFGYTDAEYGKWESGENYEGNQLEMAPEFSYNLAAQYRFALSNSETLLSSVALQGVGDIFQDLANQRKQSAYHLVNARIGYEGEYQGVGLGIYLWAKNIFDKKYTTSAFGSDAMGWFARAGDPQTFGVTLTCRF